MIADNYITIGQASELIGVTRQTISRWINTNKIKCEQIGRSKFIKKDVLIKAIINEIKAMELVIIDLKSKIELLNKDK